MIIADAHQNMLEGVRTLLTHLFEAVVMVADEASLHEAAAAVRPDLLIVDLSLPALGAGGILRSLRLRERWSLTRTIVLGIHDEPEAVETAFAAGARGYVLKRAAATELIPAVAQVLGGDFYVSPGVQRPTAPARSG